MLGGRAGGAAGFELSRFEPMMKWWNDEIPWWNDEISACFQKEEMMKFQLSEDEMMKFYNLSERSNDEMMKFYYFQKEAMMKF